MDEQSRRLPAQPQCRACVLENNQICMTIGHIFEGLLSQTNYRRQAARRIMAEAGVFGKKVQMDMRHNNLINNRG